MRRHTNRQADHDEDESVFISMTDMTVSILFVLLVLLAFFASQLRPPPRVEPPKVDPVQVYNSEVGNERLQMLRRLQSRINDKFPELHVELSQEGDALRFRGEGLFLSGEDILPNASAAKIETIAEIIDDVLPCYTLGIRSARAPECNASFALIEALQIEGHTDSDGEGAYNVALSSRRAAATYGAMISHVNVLTDHRNLAGQPVMSVAGYGEDRPIGDNKAASGKAANRRIDLQFIMVRPTSIDSIEEIRQRLSKGRPHERV